MQAPAAAPSTIRLSPADNVVVSTRIIDKGEATPEGLPTAAKIMRGHKMAAKPIKQGEAIRKFGQIIGFAKTDIAAGDWVHEHNVVMGELAHDYALHRRRERNHCCRKRSGQPSRATAVPTARWARAITSAS